MAKKPKIDVIRLAVTKNRGGLEAATDPQIKMIWISLDEGTRKQYLDSIEERKQSHAVSS